MKYAVRADYDKRVYEVYEIDSGKAVEVFKYRAKESSRGIAHGRADATRDDLNRGTHNGR